MRNRMIYAGAALAVAATFGLILPASANSEADGGTISQGIQSDPNRPDATSDPALLGVPRDQRDAPPPAGLNVERNNRGSLGQSRGDALRRAISLDPNRPDATSDPALLGIPRDQRDAPPYTGVDMPTFNAPIAIEQGVNQESNGQILQNNVQDNSVPVTPADSFNNQDPNRPDATSNPDALGAPRDQRDAPPVDPAAPGIR